MFVKAYQDLAQQTKQIISIHPAARLSVLYNAARLAAGMVSNARITLIDSNQASMGTGWLAVLAARAARLGQNLDQIVASIHDTVPRLRLLAVIDDLRYMQRSGRVRWVEALVGSLLSIKPLVMLKDGQVSLLEKVRTKAKALERLVQATVALGPLQEIAVMHANAPREAEQVANMLAALPLHIQALVAEAGTVMSTHAGPGAVGLACVLAKNGG
jgi:DegV family protein with EDD domain